ncbi:ClbS/DfsB family four-helix bundle protein [Luteimonas huabeiensis]|uniref:ClbS/DfsB family four-helix bundle protein n=1 Tax=Luteimonas huabeiensis TaxID=1244513 RepID=UPI0004651E57|nr:ClbS/DfsB family four-helix bundle protein [Luteimonas huabeiensis]
MPIPQDRAALLAAIDKEFSALLRELATLPPDAVDEATMDGHVAGSRMRPRDLVAYLVGWNERVLAWHDAEARGADIAFPAPGFKWNELGRLAQSFYEAYGDVPFDALVLRLQASKDRIVALVTGFDDDALYGRPWHGKWTRGRMIQFNTASPYANARGRLRRWRQARETAQPAR